MEDASQVHNFLNGALTDDSVVALDARLEASSALADELAESSRIDVLLARHYGAGGMSEENAAHLLVAKPTTRLRKWPAALVGAAAILVLSSAAIFFWLKRGPRNVARQPALERVDSSRPLVPPRPATPPVSVAKETDRPRDTNDEIHDPRVMRIRQLLADFYLPAIDFDNVPIGEVLSELQSMLRQFNHLQRPELQALDVRAETDLQSGPQQGPRIKLAAANATFVATLRAVAAQAQATIKWSDNAVIMSPRAPARSSGEWAEQSFPVSPHFVSTSPDGATSPFSQTTSGDSPSRRSPLEILRDLGVPFPSGAFAEFDPTSATLNVHNTAANLAIVETLVGQEGVLSQPRTMVHISGKLFELPSGVSPPDQLVEEAAVQQWLENLQRQGGVQMITVPAVTTRSGTPATVDVVGEIAGTPTRSPEWQGTRVEFLPVFEGEAIRLAGSVDVRRPGDASAVPIRDTAAAPESLAIQAVDFEAVMIDNHSAVFVLGDAGTASQVVAAFHARKLSPSGETIERRPPAPESDLHKAPGKPADTPPR